MPKSVRFLITCEHGGKRIPPRFRSLFSGHEQLLASHRGYDAGALAMAKLLAKTLAAPLLVSTTSRLLVDLNRSIRHPQLHFTTVRQASAATRSDIVQHYYLPYRNQAETAIATAIAQGSMVIHISSHSFTPELNGNVRQADIGLLYDPARLAEATLCACWQAAFKSRLPLLRVRKNYPYTGKSDGLTSYLRRRFAAESYAGIELEINQKHVLHHKRQWPGLQHDVISTLLEALETGR